MMTYQRQASKNTISSPAIFALMILSIVLAAGVSNPAARAQDADQSSRAAMGSDDPWGSVRRLEGSWEAVIGGRLGQGSGRRRYEFELEGLYLTFRHASIRLPQDLSPRGDYHREFGVFSFDGDRQIIVLRQFVVEGFVLQYTCVTEIEGFVCTSENVEGGEGMRARLTVAFSNPYHFSEVFELASPGEELETFFTNEWTKVPDFAD